MNKRNGTKKLPDKLAGGKTFDLETAKSEAYAELFGINTERAWSSYYAAEDEFYHYQKQVQNFGLPGDVISANFETFNHYKNNYKTRIFSEDEIYEISVEAGIVKRGFFGKLKLKALLGAIYPQGSGLSYQWEKVFDKHHQLKLDKN